MSAPASAIEFAVRGEFITLDRLLKALGWVESGGRARVCITEGQVQVDGQVEHRKTAKLRAGQRVCFDAQQVLLVAAPPA